MLDFRDGGGFVLGFFVVVFCVLWGFSIKSRAAGLHTKGQMEAAAFNKKKQFLHGAPGSV